MQYKKGDRVKHPKKPDWGIGQVLADSTGGTVRIFFTLEPMDDGDSGGQE